ncbi:hypothetical protein [Enterococcus plantarum]|uniref:hypothetical protein n=1 Tax=Enterococcus plantarum TaxID=1077675 RepID=UPI0015E8B410|nr:hypothetical protein [Enterococcus plantarum]
MIEHKPRNRSVLEGSENVETLSENSKGRKFFIGRNEVDDTWIDIKNQLILTK